MKSICAVIVSAVVMSACALAQGLPQAPGPDVVYAQQIAPPGPPPGPGGPGANVTFRTQAGGPGAAAGMFFVEMADNGKVVTGAPYSATATTESTQVLADGNRIVNKSTASLARDSQGRTRREDSMGNVGPWAVNGRKVVFINDPVTQTSYVLNPNDQTAQVLPPLKAHLAGPAAGKAGAVSGSSVRLDSKVVVANGLDSPMAGLPIERHVIVSTMGPGGQPDQAKTESLGTQVMEGVTVEGKRVTRTIPAAQIGNDRPLDITSEVWTSAELGVVVLSKRNDPRFGETVYQLTDIKRVEPDHALFEVPSGYTIKEMPAPPPPPPGQ